MNADKELWFTALGPSGAGKTTLLACMNREFEEVLPGSFFPADARTFSTLSQAYRKLEAEANGHDLEFGVSIEGTEDLRQYAFTIRGRKESVPVRFFDFPGGWMNPHDPSQSENYDRVIEIVRRSMVILVAINTPYLMEYDGRYGDRAGVEEIEHVLKTSLQDDTDKLVLLVPIKCERYTRSREENRRMHDRMREAFAGTLGLTQNPVYAGRLALAMLPIHTVGNAQFSRFEMSGGRIIREVYLKNRSTRFSPRDADQPLRFAMSFLLNEFALGRSSLLHDIFSQDDLREVGDFIRSGMKADDPNFEIFSGRELIEEGAPRRQRAASAPAQRAPERRADIRQEDGDQDEVEEGDPSFLPSTPTPRRRRAQPRSASFQAPEPSFVPPVPQPAPSQGGRRWGVALLGALLSAGAGLYAWLTGVCEPGLELWLTLGAGLLGALLFLLGLFTRRAREMTPEERMERDYRKAVDWKRNQDWKWLKSVRAFNNLADIFDSFGRYREAAYLAQECRLSARALRVRQRGFLYGVAILAAGLAAAWYLLGHPHLLPERVLNVLAAYQLPETCVAAGIAAFAALAALLTWWRGSARARAIRRGDWAGDEG